jgi:hypothetical protein
MDDALVKEMRALQSKLNDSAEKARNDKFRTRLQDIQKSAALGVDPEAVAKEINKLIKDYDSLPDHIRV